jgi:LPXTG-motif cell wall-anchored protein
MLSKAGLGGMLNKANVGDVLNKARTTARSNPGALLGGLAAVAIGAGLLRKRRMS